MRSINLDLSLVWASEMVTGGEEDEEEDEKGQDDEEERAPEDRDQRQMILEEVVLYQISIFNVAVQEFVGEEGQRSRGNNAGGEDSLEPWNCARCAYTNASEILSVARMEEEL